MRKAAIVFMVIPFLFLSSLSISAAEREERKWQDESIYYIVVDRFMNGEMSNNQEADLDDPKAYHGGDLAGIIDQLDYIKEMGFTAIQLSPIMQNGEKGFHGLWVTDFQAVEGHFGTLKEARQLVKKAHEQDLKVIFDLPVSFTGEEHPWTSDEGKTDWFTSENVNSELPWLKNLPQMNLSNQEVQEYFLETMNFWIDETGADGFRLLSTSDAGEEMTSINQDSFVFSEDITSESLFLSSSREAFKAAGKSLDGLVKDINHQSVHKLDGYEVERFTHLAVVEGQNPITRWKLALTYLFTTPGIPQLYYGSEIPMDDGGNLEDLPMMNFKAGDEGLKKRVEKLLSIREQFPALTRGEYKSLYNKEGLAVFERTYEDQTIIIAINNAEETKSMELKGLDDDLQLRGLLQDGLVRQQGEGTYKLGMERETADVFVIESNSGYNWLFIGFVGGVLALFVTAVIVISLRSRRDVDQ
ncbi:alpha-amylase family glycosyl hydrolase [Halobacillus litoralis]|uniref:alpha-amylase family glycosyl hydrolase n=1 Tax=Halobacillus litoralis TaxID=45668 RepID=UPI001CFDA1C9|nr:alpha-amylase family glycosyl hydrolase [Halobacillus litoralis]